MARGTRASSSSSLTDLVGKPEDLPQADLPTKRSALQQMLRLRLYDSRDARNIPIAEIAEETGKMVTEIWMKINHRMEEAIVSQKAIRMWLVSLWQKAEEISSCGKKKKSSRSVSAGKRKKKVAKSQESEKFIANLDSLLDIYICHCPMQTCSDLNCASDCLQKVHLTCSCPKDCKIPPLELEFMLDQRRKTGVRGKLQIGSKDSAETAKQKMALQRKQEIKRRQEKRKATEVADEVAEKELQAKRREIEKMDRLSEECEELGEIFMPPGGSGATQNREHFPLTMLAAMRHGVSQRGLALILSSYNIDRGLATREDPRLLVDHSKVGIEQDWAMEKVNADAEMWLRTAGIDGIQFDGKEEVAKARITLGDGAEVIRDVKEDHVTIMDSSGEYMALVPPAIMLP